MEKPPELRKKLPPPVTTKTIERVALAVADGQAGDVGHDSTIDDDQLITDPRPGGAVADVDRACIGEQGIVDCQHIGSRRAAGAGADVHARPTLGPDRVGEQGDGIVGGAIPDEAGTGG